MRTFGNYHGYLLQENPSTIAVHVGVFGPALAECLKDGNTPVRLAAERCAVHAFQLTRGMSSSVTFQPLGRIGWELI